LEEILAIVLFGSSYLIWVQSRTEYLSSVLFGSA